MTKMYIAGASVLLALLGVACYFLYASYSTNGVLRTQLEQAVEATRTAQAGRKADHAALARLREKNAVAARSEARMRVLLQEALARNQEWAETPIPEDVRNALREAP